MPVDAPSAVRWVQKARQVQRAHFRSTANTLAASFDHLVGAEKYRGRHSNAEQLRGLQIDHKLELGRLFDRQVRRLRTLENLIGENGGPTIKISKVGPVGQKEARFRKLF